MEFTQSTDDSEWWIVEAYDLPGTRPPIRITVDTGGDAPTEDCVSKVKDLLGKLDALVLDAAEHILENYSYEHFRSLGMNESLLLKDETPPGMAAVVELQSAWFFDIECTSFELSFFVPWDEEHSFDVEFEDGAAVTCAVNG